MRRRGSPSPGPAGCSLGQDEPDHHEPPDGIADLLAEHREVDAADGPRQGHEGDDQQHDLDDRAPRHAAHLLELGRLDPGQLGGVVADARRGRDPASRTARRWRGVRVVTCTNGSTAASRSGPRWSSGDGERRLLPHGQHGGHEGLGLSVRRRGSDGGHRAAPEVDQADLERRRARRLDGSRRPITRWRSSIWPWATPAPCSRSTTSQTSRATVVGPPLGRRRPAAGPTAAAPAARRPRRWRRR